MRSALLLLVLTVTSLQSPSAEAMEIRKRNPDGHMFNITANALGLAIKVYTADLTISPWDFISFGPMGLYGTRSQTATVAGSSVPISTFITGYGARVNLRPFPGPEISSGLFLTAFGLYTPISVQGKVLSTYDYQGVAYGDIEAAMICYRKILFLGFNITLGAGALRFHGPGRITMTNQYQQSTNVTLPGLTKVIPYGELALGWSLF